MKKQTIVTGIILFVVLMFGCGRNRSLQEQIKNDVVSIIGKVKCDIIPQNSVISNIIVGEIAPIGHSGHVDVGIEFDFEFNGIKKHHKDALLYSRRCSQYILEKIGGCDYFAAE